MKESMDPSWRYYGGMAVMVMVDCMFRYYLEIWNMIGLVVWIWEGGVPPPSQIKFGKGGPSGLEQSRTSSVRRFMHLERSGTI